MQPDALPVPGPIGRSARLLLGAALVVLTALTLISYRGYIRIGVPSGAWWLLAAVTLYALPQVVDIGLGRSWGVRSQAVAVGLGLAAAAVDVAVYGNLWGPPLGAFIYVAGVAVLGFMGISFVLAAIVGVPGCELRAVPFFLTRSSGGAADLQH